MRAPVHLSAFPSKRDEQRRPRAGYDHIDLTLLDYNPTDNAFHGTLKVKQAVKIQKQHIIL